MTSTIKVNNIQNECGANIANKCGSTITLGASGDTITLACGASQTGFGRTGTVDWDTTAKTASFTAVSGNGYFVNTTSGAITVTLPASPSAGDIVSVSDYAGTAATNNITIARNGSNINGAASDLTISKNNSACFLVYVDGTQGWKLTETSNINDIELQPTYIVASGGTTTTCGNYKIHTFTSPGTFTVTCVGNPIGSDTVDYLVVAGGSAGGFDRGGGGAAGGFRESSGAASGCYSASPLGACVSALPVTVQGYPITVGAGGATSNSTGTSMPPASNSVFSTITSTGGGGPGNPGPASNNNGKPGGSGGGTRDDPATGGTGNTPPVSPPQGNPGGSSSSNHNGPGGGGGGATEAGFDGAGNPDPPTFGNGGDGATTSISGSPTTYAGGGGSGGGGTFTGGGFGGTGGGGNGATYGSTSSVAGTANTGGGGGAGDGGPSANGSAGGSGIVIIRYKYQ